MTIDLPMPVTKVCPICHREMCRRPVGVARMEKHERRPARLWLRIGMATEGTPR